MPHQGGIKGQLSMSGRQLMGGEKKEMQLGVRWGVRGWWLSLEGP